MDNYYVKLGQKLRDMRESRKLTLVEVSERLKITHKTLANYETGERKVPHPTIIKLCMIYHYDLNALMDESITFLDREFYDK
jgi:transcriptional regulator with XRE-family HTH domain